MKLERVVNIYADGKLAYTGFLSMAAQRLNMKVEALQTAIDAGSQLPQPNLYYDNPFGGQPVLKPKAKDYKGAWRD
jgi:hypothetical protein